MKMRLSPTISILYLLLLLILIILGCNIGQGVEDSKNAKCVKREALALLDFKKSFASIFLFNSKLFSWNIHEEDCCAWNGIICNNHTGHVISLNLSYEFLPSYQLRPSLLELQHLRSLDLSWNDFSMRIPEFIGLLSELTYLDLSHASFYGKIPPHLGNLSSLQSLVLSQDNGLYTDNFQWLSRLSSLERLDMSGNNFNDAQDWLSMVGKLPLLSSFKCSSCSIPPPMFSPTIADHVNTFESLQTLDLSYNVLFSSITSWLMNSTINLLELHLSYMNFEGPFPDIFHKMFSLRILDLSGNHLELGTLQSIGNLCNLKELKARECGMKQSLTNTLQTMKNCASSSLETLHLGSNSFTGTFPRTIMFPSLTLLDLSSNQLDSFFPPDSSLLPILQTLNISFNKLTSLGETLHHLPTSLKGLYLSSNSFKDVISDKQVSNFSKLTALDLSNNPNLTLNFSRPPFQLEYIGLRACKLGSSFPSWLVSQKHFSWVDISNSMIPGSIPVMFWKNLPSSLRYLNFSFNNFHDIVPKLEFPFAFDSAFIDLGSNAFYGPIPFFLFCSNQLLLSNNQFSSFAPSPYASNSSTFQSKADPLFTFLDLSSNLLSGTFPDWFWLFRWNALSVANNKLCGTIPSSIGVLWQTHFLSLSNNSFSGEIPLSLKNCTELRFLDLSENKLSGSIPTWVGENLINLFDLSLRFNHFSGSLPSTLCHIRSLKMLDLSRNKLSGNIPSCVYNFTDMAQDHNFSSQLLKLFKAHPLLWSRTEAFFSYAFFHWKGKDRTFYTNLPNVKIIDLSSNDLSGEIPVELTSLVKLKLVNLSSNKLSGNIPAKMGMLKSLESLDLAWNKLSGQIPASIAEITSLEELDVSNNNLSGKIPTSTQLQSFDPSAYAGNPDLCGKPLPIKCPGDEEEQSEQLSATDGAENGSKWDMQSFYAASGTGFAVGFLAIFGTLSFNQRLIHALFQWGCDIQRWILVAAALNRTRIARDRRLR